MGCPVPVPKLALEFWHSNTKALGIVAVRRDYAEDYHPTGRWHKHSTKFTRVEQYDVTTLGWFDKTLL
jgi:hypothetical protein